MRPIDADAYAAELWKLRGNYQMLDDTHTADKIMHGIYRAEQALREQPTLDVVPVVHGEWIDLFGNEYKCSVCGEWYRMDGTPKQEGMNYCPNCGAKMDEKEKDE